MTKDERLNWLKQIEEDIYVCSLDATFEEIAKSCAIRSAIEELEKRKTGKWKAKDFHTCYCTTCNFAFDIMKCDFMDKMKYCPNCGAKMEGAERD